MHAFPHIDPDEEIRRHEQALRPVRDAVLEVVDFALPEEVAARFNRIEVEIRAKPPAVARLVRKEGDRRNWYLTFGNGVVWSVREGLGASHYHAANAADLEERVVQAAADELAKLEPPDWPSVKPIWTRKLNYEYQAYRFALRRTLDYLAVAVCAFFKQECNSINGVSKALKNASEELERRDCVVARVSRARDDLEDIIGIGKMSLRDEIAHWEAVDAGIFKIHWGKNFTIASLAEGGERLQPWLFSSDEPPRNYGAAIGFHRLAPRLRAELERVETAVFEILAELGFPA
jgi:hypothetical protein